MRSRGKLIYFGEEMEEVEVEISNDTIMVNGRPLIPSYSAPHLEEESEFKLDDETQKVIREALEHTDSHLSFEDNAQRVIDYLKEKGINVRREDGYGDVLVETDEGWGEIVLFNEEARIKTETQTEEMGHEVEGLLQEGLVIVDEGFVSFIPEKEAEEIEKKLKEVYASKEKFSSKIRKIRDILGIPEESARKLLAHHT